MLTENYMGWQNCSIHSLQGEIEAIFFLLGTAEIIGNRSLELGTIPVLVILKNSHLLSTSRKKDILPIYDIFFILTDSKVKIHELC